MLCIVRRLGIVAALVACAALPGRAGAQVFAEDWEGGTARWQVRNDTTTTIATRSDLAVCSSTYQRETRPTSGGRVFTSAGIAVTAGQSYCFTAWVRGATNTQPFIGYDKSNAAGTVSNSPRLERWLIGHTGYLSGFAGGDTVTAVTSDNAWHWYTKSFVMDPGVQFVVIKDELFSGGGSGNADFDDLRLYQGACPAGPVGAAHLACSGATPICSDGQCVACASDSDCSGATPFCVANACAACRDDADCSGSTPICDASSKTCRACSGNPDCGGSTPFCTTGGECVACVDDSACTGATPRCDTATDTCVGCLSGTDCSGTTPVCAPGSLACAGCADDSDCGGATPACQLSGACGQCSALNVGQCGGLTPVCNVLSGRCVSCTQDADCMASDTCHTARCSALFTCAQTALADGAPCTDGDACTVSASCQAGSCTADTSVSCTASDACHVAGSCSAATGLCSNPPAPDGTVCPGGTCQTGTCVPSSSSSSSSGSGSASGSTGSTTTATGSASGSGSTGASGGTSGSASSGSSSSAGSASATGSSGASGTSGASSASGSNGGSAGAGATGGSGGVGPLNPGALAGGGCGCGTQGGPGAELLFVFGALLALRRRAAISGSRAR